MSEAALAIKVFFANSVSSPAQNLSRWAAAGATNSCPDGATIAPFFPSSNQELSGSLQVLRAVESHCPQEGAP
jgi:hypothetical protein